MIAKAIFLLIVSNVFMTLAWYGHLKFKQSPLWLAILLSWGLAFFEYIFQVPANRIGSGALSVTQLKITQEVITL
ncbi:DMT family protein, partial [Escherichia coli]|nr:DMT family protein [Escherichia coli]